MEFLTVNIGADMYRLLRTCVIILTAHILLFFFADSTYAVWQSKVPRHRAERIRAKNRAYIKSRNESRVGEADAKNGLVRVKDYGTGLEMIYIIDKKGNLYEIMDMNCDGDVEQWEIEEFYRIYDKDNNGVLENIEINAMLESDFLL